MTQNSECGTSVSVLWFVVRYFMSILVLSSSCLVMVERLFLAVTWGCLRFVIVVFPDHTHYFLWFLSKEQWLNVLFNSMKKVSNGAKIRNRYNQVPHLTQDTNGKVTNSQKTPQTRAKRSALSQQVTTKHI